ncbi:hypothetical protein QWY84_11525 [Aquisalimonas lutea]|uniref:hypothetical protein n=1 Tax=Aquisalimonas lutea TaxID=1327750 RepID=UPI0025B28B4C|nr:hypothetical protein [Aquisalimonas lutea]MDN3518243.1 hypothetical protein [Aquisalimonas lutea]
MSDGTVDTTYWQRLEAIAAGHGDAIARAFRLRPGFLEAEELAIVLNFALGGRLEREHGEASPLAVETVLEGLAAMPAEQCHPRTAVEALAWYDRGTTQGRRIPDVLRQGALFQPAIERAFRGRRRERTQRSMRQLIENNRKLADAVDELVDALGEPGSGRASHAAVRSTIKRIQAILRSSEWHCRAAAAWSVKNGFAVDGVGQAVHRLLLQPLRRMARLMEELEEHLELPQRQRCSPQIRRICRRVLLELMDAAAVEWERTPPGCNRAHGSTG